MSKSDHYYYPIYDPSMHTTVRCMRSGTLNQWENFFLEKARSLFIRHNRGTSKGEQVKGGV